MKQGTNLHVITWSHTIGLRQVRFRSPTMLSIHLVIYWGERERAPSCGLNGRAVTIDIYYRYIIYIYNIYVRYVPTAHARRYAQT